MTRKPALEVAILKLAESQALLHAATEAQTQASTHLQQVIEAAVKTGSSSFRPEAFPITEHRRLHRPGNPSKIDADPELRAFILARMDHMSFQRIAADVAAQFPEPRRVRKSAIHAWWSRNRKPPTPQPQTAPRLPSEHCRTPPHSSA